MKGPFSPYAQAVIGVCAVIDLAAGLILMTSDEAVRMCGPTTGLYVVFMIAVGSFFTIPLAIGIVTVGLAFTFPALRRPRLWIASAALLTIFCWYSVHDAAARIPEPHTYIGCVLRLHHLGPRRRDGDDYFARRGFFASKYARRMRSTTADGLNARPDWRSRPSAIASFSIIRMRSTGSR